MDVVSHVRSFRGMRETLSGASNLSFVDLARDSFEDKNIYVREQVSVN